MVSCELQDQWTYDFHEFCKLLQCIKDTDFFTFDIFFNICSIYLTQKPFKAPQICKSSFPRSPVFRCPSCVRSISAHPLIMLPNSLAHLFFFIVFNMLCRVVFAKPEHLEIWQKTPFHLNFRFFYHGQMFFNVYLDLSSQISIRNEGLVRDVQLSSVASYL